MSLYYKDYPKEMLPYLGLTVFDTIKKTDSIPVYDGYLPHVSEVIDDRHIRIQTYQSRYHKETALRFFRFYLVFDVMNNIKDECRLGHCVVTKNDSIGAITIPYPSKTSYEVDWHMELSSKLEKYLVNSQEYSLNPSMFKSEYLKDRVKVNNHIHIINWRDQVDRANSDIRNYLSDKFLVTHIEDTEVTTMEKLTDEAYKDTKFYNMTIPHTHTKKRKIVGFLNQLNLPDYIVL